jgi:hypothetical protein
MHIYELLALVPCATEPGDIICIIPGCSVPVVLRRLYGPVGGKPLYKFIGESYVHGMMDGEAFGKKMRDQDGI